MTEYAELEQTAQIFDQPFPHAVIESLYLPETIREINREWPASGWRQHHHYYSQKRAIDRPEAFGPTTRGVIAGLNEIEFVEHLSRSMGIPALGSDPDLMGGGLHEVLPGGFLGIHADFNIHPKTRLYRRLNLLLFLNEEWREEWGGHLELWDREKTGQQVKVSPIGGRAVLFATSDTSFHGHPEPLRCPEGITRRSLALYYYSPEPPPDSRTAGHSTLYIGDEENWFQKA